MGQQLRGAVVAAKYRTDTILTSCCSGGGPRQPWFSGLAPVSRFHSSVPFSHSSPSLTGLLASVDVKQQKLTNSLNSVDHVYCFLCCCVVMASTGWSVVLYSVCSERVCALATGMSKVCMVQDNFLYTYTFRGAHLH